MPDIVRVGAAGRMGAAITLAATESSGCRVVAGVDPIAAASGDTRWSQSLAAAYRKGTVVVDFSSPSGAVASALGYALWYAVVANLTGFQSGIVQLAPTPLAVVGGILPRSASNWVGP